MSLALLHAIHASGEALRSVIKAGDYDLAAALATERERLVEQLLAEPRPPTLPEEWAEARDALAAQDRALRALAAEHDRAFSDTLAQTSRQREAHAAYGSAAPGAQRLRSVHG
jgi:hypothetical protein